MMAKSFRDLARTKSKNLGARAIIGVMLEF